MSTVPSRAVAILCSSETIQSVPTPRQSHWKTPLAASMAACSVSGDSCSSLPSVSRMACLMPGSRATMLVMSCSHEPIAVPPLASSRPVACCASARVWLDDVARPPVRG